MYRDDRRPVSPHPSWCLCRGCELRGRKQEQRALGSDLERAEVELGPPPAGASARDLDPYDIRREELDRRGEEREVFEGAFA